MRPLVLAFALAFAAVGPPRTTGRGPTRRRRAILALALVAALAPAASGHGIVFSADPLQFNLDGYPAADKTVQLAPPAAGTVYFEAYQPGTAAKPIDFTL